MPTLTPRQIVAELDKYVIGQADAKRCVAIALRNRWRRQQVPEPLRDEIAPKNIIMMGPTGVGKTEIARRLARLAEAPFLKVEASKFTEVGYVGRDVESMVRDLVELTVNHVQRACRTGKCSSKRPDEIAEETRAGYSICCPGNTQTIPSSHPRPENLTATPEVVAPNAFADPMNRPGRGLGSKLK